MSKFVKAAIGATLLFASLTHCGNAEPAADQQPSVERSQSEFISQLNAINWTTIETRIGPDRLRAVHTG